MLALTNTTIKKYYNLSPTKENIDKKKYRFSGKLSRTFLKGFWCFISMFTRTCT